jgi:hypothetical protein
MPQGTSVFCNFYIRVDREALVSERALDVGSIAFKAMSTKKRYSNKWNIVMYSQGKIEIGTIHNYPMSQEEVQM